MPDADNGVMPENRDGCKPIVRWGILFRSKNDLDGYREYIVCSDCQPVLFQTRDGARLYARDRYAYIGKQRDLRREPHGWLAPKIVRLQVALMT